MADTESPRLLIDEPSHIDRLEYERFLTALDRLVFEASEVQTPLTIAVYGSWGSGKSSLLRMLRKRLSPGDNTLWTPEEQSKKPPEWERASKLAERFVAAEFSPWSHRKETNLLVPLLLSLKEQLKPTAKMSQEIVKIAAITGWHIGRAVVWPLAKKAASAAVKAATIGLVDVEKEVDAVLDPEQIEKSAKQVEGDFERDQPKLELSDHAKVRELVAKFVKKVRKQKGKERTLVLLIDDLDRCHPPEQIIELLEQIKLFLSIEGCLFVLACDREVVVKAIEGKFPGQGAAYLDKFVQLPIHLHAPKSEQVARLIAAGSPSSSGGDGDWHGYLLHIADALRNNPRRFKRFVNSLRLGERVLLEQSPDSHSALTSTPGEPWFDRHLLAKWIVIRDACPQIAERPQLLLDLEAGGQLHDGKVSDKVRDHLGIDPAAWLFLRLDADRRFGSIQRLSIYSRLTGQNLDISRTDIERRALTKGKMPDDLSGLDLSHAILRGADFGGCNLMDVNLSHAELRGANFDGAKVLRTDFSFARIDGTSWQGIQSLEHSVQRQPINGIEQGQIDEFTVRRIATLALRGTVSEQFFPDFPSDAIQQGNFVPATSTEDMANAFASVDLDWFGDVIATFQKSANFKQPTAVEQRDYWKNVFNLISLRKKQG